MLGERILRRVRRELAITNEGRASHGLAPWPEPTCTWLVHPFRREGKINSDLERHGYVNLADLSDEDSAVKKAWFPPYRDFFIPQPCW
mgnify:FL=1